MTIKDKLSQLWEAISRPRSFLGFRSGAHGAGSTKPVKAVNAAKPGKQKRARFAGLLKTRRLLLLIALGAALTLILSINLISTRVSLDVGEIAGEDIYYDGVTTSYVSQLRTEEARAVAAAQVGQIFVEDPTVARNLLAYIDQCFEDLLAAKTGQTMTVSELAAALPGQYSQDTLDAMLDLSQADIIALRDLFKGIVSTSYEQGITKDELDGARENMAAAIASSTVTGYTELFLKTLLEGLELTHNKEYDALATAQAVETAMNGVGMVQVTVQSGEKLVSRGAVVTEGQVEALQALGLHSDNSPASPYVGLAALVALGCVLLQYYLKLFQPAINKKPNSILLLTVILLLVLLLCKLISLIIGSNNGDFGQLIGYMLPTGAAAMLISVLLSQDLAIFCVALFAVFTGVMMNGQFACVLVALASGLTAAFCASRLNQRSQFVGASVYIALANGAVILGYGLIESYSLPYIGVGLLFGLANGLLCAILAMGTLPFLESGFGVNTTIRLLELSNSNHPLLKRLMMEAPGTYNHSILVGNLAEAAADAIGADPLLVRVASYYHDIGKLRRPYFFIENQHPGENPHDKLQPALSAVIITSHAVEGGKMLRENKFPQEIIDLVEQHHGTGLLSYFYYKALEQAEDKDKVKKEDFRYKGKKPQTREAGLVLLADSVQAAVQALSNPTKEQMAQVVADVLRGKIDDGQLQECPLTFKDLEQISQSFMMVLSGMYHSRIAYPTQALEKGEEEHEDLSVDQSGAGKIDGNHPEAAAAGGTADHRVGGEAAGGDSGSGN